MYCLALTLSIITLLLSLVAFAFHLIKKISPLRDQSKIKLRPKFSNHPNFFGFISHYYHNEFSNRSYLIILLFSSRYNSQFKNIIRALPTRAFAFLIISIFLGNISQAQKNMHKSNFHIPAINTVNCNPKMKYTSMINPELREIYFVLIIGTILPSYKTSELETWPVLIDRLMASFHKPFQILLNFATLLFCLSPFLTIHKTPDILTLNSEIIKKTLKKTKFKKQKKSILLRHANLIRQLDYPHELNK
jgi:hypothetical protein